MQTAKQNPILQKCQPSYVLLTILVMSYCPRFLTLRTVTVELLKVLSTLHIAQPPAVQS